MVYKFDTTGLFLLHSCLKSQLFPNLNWIWNTMLPSSPICWGIFLLPLWSPYPHIQHSHYPHKPSTPSIQLSFLTPPSSWHHCLTYSLYCCCSLPLILSLSVAVFVFLSFFLPFINGRSGSSKKREGLLCWVYTWVLTFIIQYLQALKRGLWPLLHQGK